MGGQPTKLKKTSIETQEPEMLQKDSLDLIYIDDYFDDPRYLKALEKHNRKVKVQQSKAMKRVANQTKNRLKLFQAMSDSFLTKKRRTPMSSRSRSHSPKGRPTTYSIAKKGAPSSTKSKPKTPHATSSKSTVSVAKRNASSPKPLAPSKTKSAIASKPSSGGRQVYATTVPPVPIKSSTIASKQVGPSTNSFQTKSSSKIPLKSTKTVPPVPPNSATTDKKNQGFCFGFFHSPQSVTSDDVKLEASKSKTKTTTKTEKTGDHSQTHEKHGALPHLPGAQLRKPRSAFTTSSVGTGKSSTIPPHHSYDDIAMRKGKPTAESKTRPTSLNRNWAPSSSAAAATARGRPVTTVISRASQASSGADSNSSKKKKLVVRGLQHYVNTHRRSGPSLWDREFPPKSKFHPDNYIYEHEGPRCPPRPCSAMAKCRKHGGRCDVCGIFTCDLCQRCRKCELDCCCPKAPPCPNPMNLYSEMFGDGWKKTCKVITDLTEKDKSNPVGGNANKRRQVCQSLNNQDRNQGCYQPHQIDVLNPYGFSCDEPNSNQHQFPMPGPYGPFCPPPMLPYMPSMTFMPIPMMPPPMPFYPPPPPYDPYMYPSPYPPSDSFMPNQNY